MVIEIFRLRRPDEAYARLGAKGRMLPAGLDYVDSRLDASGARRFQLMETEDRGLFAPWTAQWDDLVDFEIIPLRDKPA